MLFVDGGVASSEILAIAVSRESNTWDSLRTILTDKTLLQDWGPFKNQHRVDLFKSWSGSQAPPAPSLSMPPGEQFSKRLLA